MRRLHSCGGYRGVVGLGLSGLLAVLISALLAGPGVAHLRGTTRAGAPRCPSSLHATLPQRRTSSSHHVIHTAGGRVTIVCR